MNLRRPLVASLLISLLGAAVAESQLATGRIQTVTGPIAPDSLGFTLPHEHLFVDFLLPDLPTGYRRIGAPTPRFVRWFQELGNISWVPRTAEELAFWDRPALTIDMLPRLRGRWQTKSNYVLDDESDAIEEVVGYLAAGGRSLVDVTPVGIGREPTRLRRVAERTGLQIVMGTAFYRWPYRTEAIRALTAGQMADLMVRELTEGIDGTGIKAGIIGEIPVDAHSVHLDGPLDQVPSDAAVRAAWAPRYERMRSGTPRAEEIYDPEEIKSLTAAAWASRRTGAAITLHAVDPWIGYLDVLEREGADLSRVVVGHGSWLMADTVLARRAFARGVTVQLDWEMQVMATGETAPVELLLDRIAWAVSRGFVRQLTLSLDVCLKVGRKRYGGGGLTQLHERLLPGLRARGVPEADLRIITVDNPRRILTLVAPKPLGG
ncbi:MAG: phosphotriesterase [Gemmatimonadetes bacterium]|nr:phosphotriesterase [Gemmatimonadota bacterium]